MILLFRYKTRGRQAGLGVPQVPQPRPEQAERCPPHLRLHRHPVLEPGPHRRDQGPRAASVILPLQQPTIVLSKRPFSLKGGNGFSVVKVKKAYIFLCI